MIIKFIAIAAFIIILASLGNALYHLVSAKDQQHSQKTARALTYRIGLSLSLFVLLAIALFLGGYQPDGIGARIAEQQYLKGQVPAPQPTP